MFQLKVTVNDSFLFFWIFFLGIIFEVSFIFNVGTSFFSGGGAGGGTDFDWGIFHGTPCIMENPAYSGL